MANPSPLIIFSGDPIVGNILSFSDQNAIYYDENVVSATWNFGDGNISSTTSVSATFEHFYNNVGFYTISVSAFSASSVRSISSMSANYCESPSNMYTTETPSWLSAWANSRNLSSCYWIEDDFETSSFNCWWSSAFSASYDLSSVSGSEVAVMTLKDSTTPFRLLSRNGTSLSGDFIFETSIFKSPGAFKMHGISLYALSADINNLGDWNNASGSIVRIAVLDNGGLGGSKFNNPPGTTGVGITSSDIIGLKFQRNDGIISTFYKNGESDWFEILGCTNISYSDNVYAVVEGNGYEGFDYFRLAAQSGLPNLYTFTVNNNYLSNTKIISILSANNCKAKEDYITICGPDILGRYGSCRNINLVEYLPIYLRDGETEEFLILFQDFLNEMYSGLWGWQLSGIDLPISGAYGVENVSSISAEVNISSTYNISGSNVITEASDAQEIQINWPTNAAYNTSAQKISILEKIHRLTELHDPDLIDIQYIQFFAKNLGYNIKISRDEIGNSGTNEQFGQTEFQNDCSASDINKYLRFVISNLPTWYKIKTTRNAIKVMLYSFGLVGEIIEYFTNNYKSINNGGSWRLNYNNLINYIPNNWFPTSHYAIWIDIENSSDLSYDINRKQKVIRAIDSIRPINTVFDSLYGYIKRDIQLTCAGFVRFSRQIRLKSEGYSNGWAGW